MGLIKYRIWDMQLLEYLYILPEQYHLDFQRFIVEQYALGLTDKNGREICQGDQADSCYGKGEVILTERGFMFEFDTDITDLWSICTGGEKNTFQIIDTIHDR